MAGRPRKVVEISTGKIGKQKRLNRKIQEENIKLDRKALEAGAPAWLSDGAKEEFNRVVAEAKKINLFDNLDMAVLAIYADCYDKYVKASSKLKEFGMTIEVKGNLQPSPFFMIMDKMATQVMKCSTKLGLAVTDRLKLIVPTKEEKTVNKFLSHLEG